MKLLPLLLIAVVVVAIVAENRSYRQRHTKRPPPPKRTRRPRIVVDPETKKLCKQSILSRLNPTESCKRGCLITCGRKSTNTVGRCEVCRDKCCEATCTGYDCIPVSQISDIVGSMLDIYKKYKEISSSQAEGSTETPLGNDVETGVEEATDEGVENGELP